MSNRRRRPRQGDPRLVGNVPLIISELNRDATQRMLIRRSVEDDVGALLAKGIAFFRNHRLDVQDDIETMIARHGARPVIDYMAGVYASVVREQLFANTVSRSPRR